ncbi:uncharacterized protein Dana_GF24865 [Drosophila ananassae]|uniref:Uncharacterized protein n=1 Tax=Drosophila ananassae TaxID=7217 RepID=B3M6P7_DROAN|nr:uncharacterized protein LOC6507494 isoform X1 [Drosophila ananassae]EDV38697.2 uncharacterized protein Dana_GF24865 [Drosophila ananassae]
MDALREKISDLFPRRQQPKLKQDEGPRSEAEGITLPSEPQIDTPLYPRSEKLPPLTKDPLNPLVPREEPSSSDRRARQTKEEEKRKAPLDIDYEMEFINFVDRNAPKGFSKRFMEVLPYLELSFLSWPTFWAWRGYNWQFKRNSEKLGVYIHRTYQQAKAMQFCILATGLLAVSMARPSGQAPLQLSKTLHEKSHSPPEAVPLAQANDGLPGCSEQCQGEVPELPGEAQE